MKKSAYSEKFLDPRWQKRRLQILERDGWQCTKCDETTKTLDVHHRYYIPKRDPWAYPDGCLLTLCRECHKLESVDREDWNPNTHREWELTTDVIFSEGDAAAWDFTVAMGMSKSSLGYSLTEIMLAIEKCLADPNRTLTDCLNQVSFRK